MPQLFPILSALSRGFYTQNATRSAGDAFGIYLNDSDNNTFREGDLLSKSIATAEATYFPGGQAEAYAGNAYGIYFSNSNKNTVSNKEIKSRSIARASGDMYQHDIAKAADAYGIYVTNSDKNTFEKNTIFSESVARADLDPTGSEHTGISRGIYLLNSDYNNLLNNDFHVDSHDDKWSIGIWLKGSTHSKVKGNVTEGGQYGIALTESSNNNLVSNNSVKKTDGFGIFIGGSETNTLESNTVKGTGGFGIRLVETEQNVLSGNTIVQGGGIMEFDHEGEHYEFRRDGLYLRDTNENLISGNIVADSGGHGVYLDDSHNNFLYTNTVENSSSTGIAITVSHNNAITANEIKDGQIGVSIGDRTNRLTTIEYEESYDPFTNFLILNSITGNKTAGLKADLNNPSSDTFDATLNWWGSEDGPTVDWDGNGREDETDYFGGGDKIVGTEDSVPFSPWISGPDVNSDKDGIQIDTSDNPGLQLPRTINITVAPEGPIPEADTSLSGWMPADDPTLPLWLSFNETSSNLIPTFDSVNYAADWEQIDSLLSEEGHELAELAIKINSGERIPLNALKDADDKVIEFSKNGPIPMGGYINYSILLKEEGPIYEGSFELGTDSIGASPDIFNSRPGYLNRAIGAANVLEGRDEIYVEPGEYSGGEPILDPVLIQGADNGETVVKEGEPTIYIAAEDTSVQDLTVRGNLAGMILSGASRSNIADNVIGAIQEDQASGGFVGRSETNEVSITGNSFLGKETDPQGTTVGSGLNTGIYLAGGSGHIVARNDFSETGWQDNSSAIVLGAPDVSLASDSSTSVSYVKSLALGIVVGPETEKIENIKIRKNEITSPGFGAGIKLYPGTVKTELKFNVISNGNNGILLNQGPNEIKKSNNEARYNSITKNRNYGVLNETNAIFDAALNWWGDRSGPYHPTENSDGTGNQVSDNVIFSPWLRENPDSKSGSNNPGVQLPNSLEFMVDDVGPEPEGGYLHTALEAANSDFLPGQDTIYIRSDEEDNNYKPVVEYEGTIGTKIVILSGGSSLEFNRNIIDGKVEHHGKETADFSFNYWGSPPQVDGNKGNLLLTPWLEEPPGTEPMTYKVADIGAEPEGGLTRALDDANDDAYNDTVRADEGTYNVSTDTPVREPVDLVTCTGCPTSASIEGELSIKSSKVDVGGWDFYTTKGFNINADVTISSDVDASTVSINWNNIYGTVTNNDNDELDATYNWWGGDNPNNATVGDVDYDPYLPVNVCSVLEYMEEHEITDPENAVSGIVAENSSPSEQATAEVTELGLDPEQADSLIEEYGRSQVLNALENAETSGEFVQLLNGFRLPAGAAGGLTNNTVAGGAGSVGGKTVGAVFIKCETIKVNFPLADFQGNPTKNLTPTVSLVELDEDGNKKGLEEVTTATYEENRAAYVATFSSCELAPGYYQVHIDLVDGSSLTQVIQVQEKEE